MRGRHARGRGGRHRGRRQGRGGPGFRGGRGGHDGMRRRVLGRLPAGAIARPRPPRGGRSRLRHRGAGRSGARYGPRRLRPRGRRALRRGDCAPRVTAFTWIDGERLIRFAVDAAAEAPALLAQRGFEEVVLLTTGRAVSQASALAGAASAVYHVPDGPVPEAAAVVRGDVDRRPLVALGGGRVIDAAKGIAGADGLPCAAVPTTLSGAPMTRLPRMPAGAAEGRPRRPSP